MFSKKWFDLFEITDEITKSHFYGIKPQDYVTAVAFDDDGMILLIIQEDQLLTKIIVLKLLEDKLTKGDSLESIKELREELGMSFEIVRIYAY